MTTVLAVDLGGSKILACLVQNGQVLEERRVPTPRAGGVAAWMDAVGELAGPWTGRFALAGVAVTGLVRRGRWQALNPDTLPIPAGFLLEAELTRRLRVPVSSLNDAQAAAWGEHVAGAGKGVQDLVFVTISTGIGGGVILGGQLVMGRSGMAAGWKRSPPAPGSPGWPPSMAMMLAPTRCSKPRRQARNGRRRCSTRPSK
jgi:N-acetylmannosamine-6-phosphate 2-epimerase/N-acetylmannosamine kinase